MKVYCAAPMRGYPLYNHPAIHAAVSRLRAAGHEAFSPAEVDLSHGKDPASGEAFGDDPEYMRKALAADLTWITTVSDVVVVLPGWQRSRGAQAEVHAAVAVGIPVQELEGFLSGNGAGSITWEQLHGGE
jgi:hypothetical protein